MKSRLSRAIGLLTSGLVLTLGACASAPEAPVSETLDEGTGTTTAAMASPVELVAEIGRGGDPFAYLAPFETNRMGERTLYLWVAAPQGESPLALPQIECDAEPLGVAAVPGDLVELGLSQAPYTAPTPWSAQWYYRLPAPALDCLARARAVTIVTRDLHGTQQRYTARAEGFPALAAFAAQVGPGTGVSPRR